jgi:hypothetical protein
VASVVTATGDAIIVGRMRGSTPTQAEPLNCGWGTNPAALTAAHTDIAPFTEATESRVAGTSSVTTTTTTNDTYTVVGTIVVAGAGKTVGEWFLSDSTTKPAAGAVAAGGVVGSNSATTLNTAATFTPGNGNYIQIRTEVMLVTAGSGTTVLTVTRAQNGTAAISTIAVADAVQPGNPPGNTAITGGSLFAHMDFTGLALNIGDSLALTANTKVT